MKYRVLPFILPVFSLVVLSWAAHAATLRCDGDLAQIGDAKGSVPKKCGEPMAKESFCNPDEAGQ